MIKRKINRVLVFLMSLVMVFTMFPDTSAFAVTQKEIDALKAQRNEIREQRQAKQAVVDELEGEHSSLLEQKRAMDERNMYTIEQMELNAEEIALYDEMIAAEGEKLKDALKIENEQLERYRERVRAMEENGNHGFLALILNATSLGELLTVVDDIGEIMESDRELEDTYIEARKNTEAVKAEYESFKADVEAKQAELKEEQAELEKDIQEAMNLLKNLEDDIENHQTEIDEISAIEDQANEEINKLVAQLEKEREEERKRQEAEKLAQQQAQQQSQGGGGGGGGGAVSGNGSFIWPTPSCTYITSGFGERVHPITGKVKRHWGLDIGAQMGAQIIASDGGTVITAGDTGNGYGTHVIIDHGNGYITVYGHMSSVAVSEGQTVSQGSVIGYVGSTGFSTGPHLHFEIRSGGGAIDPSQFFSGLSYSPDA